MGEALATIILFAMLGNLDRPLVAAIQMFAALAVLAFMALVAVGAIHV